MKAELRRANVKILENEEGQGIFSKPQFGDAHSWEIKRQGQKFLTRTLKWK